MKVADLLAEDTLQLRLHTPSSRQRLARSISFCAQAEFLDPTPFLSASCLLITNGIGFNFSDDRIWDAYVERLADVPVAALAFVTGAAHRLIPPGLVRAATNHNVPLLEVPHVVPALQVQRFVTSVLEAERFALTKQSWALADRCARIAGAGGALRGLLAEIADATKGQVAIFDAIGDVVASWPKGSGWTHEDLRRAAAGTQASSFELPMGGTETFHLVARGGLSREPLTTLLGPASSILAVQLNNVLKASGQKAARMTALLQQFGDWEGVATDELTRTFRAAGLDPQAATYLVVARPGPDDSTHPWKIRLAVQELFSRVQMHSWQGNLFAFAQSSSLTGEPPESITQQLLESCRQVAGTVPIIVKGPADSVDELRLGVADARHKVLHVSEPVIPAPLNLQSLIAATAGGGARAAAHKLLAPVLAYDHDHDSALLQTLKTYLKHNAQPSQTSRDLYIHRNTLSKRLRLLSELMRLPLDTLDGQATCLMALRITDL
ncbi:helix-turn-helix domain-containing protein [Specibacter cremeus]|uniref:helix-turn-helix domain-containing protein n=1 Tax=Specibacter cremeus TaxID=1629051 RepID=UPI000F798106|nr:helix-turn-helix domain-containing protein [Specibacter cremeus]